MTSLKLFWLSAYISIIAASNLSYSFITGYIGSKPLGLQSIYDTVLWDHIWCQCYKTFFFVADGEAK
jgi:hypothetical protein